MSKNQTEEDLVDDRPSPADQPKFKALRIWPIILALLGIVATRYIPRLIEDESTFLVIVMILGPVVFSLLILIWWVGFSRAALVERIIGLLGIAIVAAVTMFASHETMWGPAFIVIMIPMGMASFAAGAILFSQHLSAKRTWFALFLAMLGFGFTAFLQSSGMWGNGRIDWSWRWQSTAEQTMLANRNANTANDVAEESLSDFDRWIAEPEWPRFRGADGMSRQSGFQIDVDWQSSPPVEIWRTEVGPGWSSFVVAGKLLFTQEQRGEYESVVCYLADSGTQLWAHQIESRFFDPLGGPGPRATPTLSEGRLFAQGANGQLQRLNPRTGESIWEQDIREIAEREPPTWGFSSSPLVVGPVVITHAGGENDKGVLAFDVQTGELKWSAASGDHSYSSPQLSMLAGQQVVLMLTNAGLNVLDPETGKPLLDYEWPHQGYRAIQPPVIDGDSVLLATQDLGTRRIRVSKLSDDEDFTVEEVWTTRQLKPDFNDFVIHENHAYGFDGTIFTCVDLETGERKWKRGRYGKGQVLLLADSDTLLVQNENGDVVLLATNPDKHQEIATLKAFDGRTWNHPVVVGDRLYVRNSTEAACYRLPQINENVQTD